VKRARRREVGALADWVERNPQEASYLFTHDEEWVAYWQGLTWPNKRKIVLARDGHECLYCRGHATHVDHLHPRSRRGGDEWWNLAAACSYCNLAKHAHIPYWVNEWQRLQAQETAAWPDAMEYV
jgi:5-methylcytosine-specific restriction endonuclease McrA